MDDYTSNAPVFTDTEPMDDRGAWDTFTTLFDDPESD
jgi:hypothetical protein